MHFSSLACVGVGQKAMLREASLSTLLQYALPLFLLFIVHRSLPSTVASFFYYSSPSTCWL